MITFPNAKINIGLNITEKRADGFHNIESVFYPVAWCDVLEILPASAFSFQSTGLVISGNEASNLCVKAYQLLRETGIEIEKRAVSIHLHKVIPMGAGLGGGSADGAFVLKGINEVCNLGLSNAKLQTLARQLGSDCAFFIENKPVFCYEKGDQFEEIDLNLSGKHIVLVNPAIHISTAEAYAGIRPKKADIDLKTAITAPINTWRESIKNDFEEELLKKYPAIAQLKQQLYDTGAVYSSMTGSGSTVYGIFENEPPKMTFENYAVWSGGL